MVRVRVSDFRKSISDLGNKVAYTGERICVQRNDKPLFVVVPVDDAELLDYLEDKIDLEAIKEALKKKDFVPWEKAKKELGLPIRRTRLTPKRFI
jgi:prevent-host-death family protein